MVNDGLTTFDSLERLTRCLPTLSETENKYQSRAALCGWEGNRRSGVALAMRYRH